MMMRAAKPPPAPRLAAIAILLALVALVFGVLILPVWSAWSARADEADRLADLIAHLHRAAQEAPAIEAQLATIGAAQRDKAAILIAPTPNIAGVNLQSELKRIADAHGIAVRSVQQLPPVPEAELNRIALKAEFQIEPAQLSQILYDLENHSPLLLVRHLAIRGDEQQSLQPNPRSAQLNVQLEISALTGPAE